MEDVSAPVRRQIAAGVRVHLGLLQFRIADMLSTSHLFTAAFRHLEEARPFGKDVVSHQVLDVVRPSRGGGAGSWDSALRLIRRGAHWMKQPGGPIVSFGPPGSPLAQGADDRCELSSFPSEPCS